MWDTLTPSEREKYLEKQDLLKGSLAMIGELLLTVLPLIVLTIVERAQGKSWWHVLESPEWSFGASVLFGLSILKFVTGETKMPGAETHRTGFRLVVLISLGLTPSLVTLALVLSMPEVPTGLIQFQLVLFIYGALSFFVYGALSHVRFTYVERKWYLQMREHAEAIRDAQTKEASG
jgi:hypothetical protein